MRAFQQHKGLIVDGVVGVETFTAIDGARWALGDRILRAHPRPPAARRGRRRPCRSGSTPSASPPGGSTAASAPRPSGPCAASSAPTACPGTARSAPTRCGPSTTCAGRCPGARPTCCASASWSGAPATASSGAPSCSTPGHGGGNTGAVAHGLVESEVVMDLARRIEGRLTAIGVAVVYTRTEHTSPTEDERAALANDAGADLAAVAALRLPRRGRGQRRGHLLLRARPHRPPGRRSASTWPTSSCARSWPAPAWRTAARTAGPGPCSSRPACRRCGSRPATSRTPATPPGWPTRPSATPSPRPSWSASSGSTSATTTPPPPVSCGSATCAPTSPPQLTRPTRIRICYCRNGFRRSPRPVRRCGRGPACRRSG